MAQTNTDLAVKIQQSTGKENALAFQKTFNDWFNNNLPNVTALAGTPEEARKIFAVFLGVVNRNPELLNCTKASLIQCLSTSMSLKLYPGPFQECAYVPLGNKRLQNGQKEANFWPQYQGLIKLAYNAGFVRKISASVVWAADEFSYHKGLEASLVHRPFEGKRADRGERMGVYAVWKTRYGESDFEYLTAERIAAFKARSRGATRSDSPWNSSVPDDVDWMWKKCALRQALKMLPKSAELAEAIELDTAVDDESAVKPKVFDFSVDPVEGEVVGEGGKEQ